MDGAWLESCFDLASQRRSCLIRPAAEELARLKKTLSGLESALNDGEEFGASILVNSFFLQLMVELNRAVRRGGGETARSLDPKIDAALYYINTHLGEPMTVDTLAGMCYLSRFYFMRRFKDATGYTVHSYIQQKRLAAAAERLETGAGVTETAMELGFAEYTSFLRAFRKALRRYAERLSPEKARDGERISGLKKRETAFLRSPVNIFFTSRYRRGRTKGRSRRYSRPSP